MFQHLVVTAQSHLVLSAVKLVLQSPQLLLLYDAHNHILFYMILFLYDILCYGGKS